MHNDTFHFKADYYTMEVENYIAACNSGASVYFCNAPGTSNVQGVELQSMYDAGIVFAGASYTYTHTDLPPQTAGFGAATFVPEHVAVGSAGVRLLEQKLTLGGRVSYFSKSYVGDVNAGPFNFYAEPYMPAYTLVDFFSKYKFDGGFEVGLNIDNVLNESYTDALSSPQGIFTSGCFGSNNPGCNTSGMGRTYYLTAKAQF